MAFFTGVLKRTMPRLRSSTIHHFTSDALKSRCPTTINENILASSHEVDWFLGGNNAYPDLVIIVLIVVTPPDVDIGRPFLGFHATTGRIRRAWQLPKCRKRMAGKHRQLDSFILYFVLIKFFLFFESRKRAIRARVTLRMPKRRHTQL
jgi:hypothetical protein